MQKNNIERKKLPKVRITDNRIEHRALREKLAKGENVDISKYYLKRDRGLERILRSVKSTVAGENRVGKILSGVKNIVSRFIPLGREIDSVTDVIGDALKSKPKYKIMNKSPLLSKTVWSAMLIALTAVLSALGVDFSANPELVQNIYEIIFGLAGAFGLYGLREAVATEIQDKIG